MVRMLFEEMCQWSDRGGQRLFGFKHDWEKVKAKKSIESYGDGTLDIKLIIK